MSTWNHVILERTYPSTEDTYYGIYEAFFDKDSKVPNAWTSEPESLEEESVEDLIKTLESMLLACQRKVFNYHAKPSGEILEVLEELNLSFKNKREFKTEQFEIKEGGSIHKQLQDKLTEYEVDGWVLDSLEQAGGGYSWVATLTRTQESGRIDVADVLDKTCEDTKERQLLLEKNKKFKEYLMKYGGHDLAMCAMFGIYADGDADECTCGWQEVLEEINKEK